MKARDVGLSLLGGTIVYVAMAACSAGGSSLTTGSSHAVGSGGFGGHGGDGQGGAGNGEDSGIFDALTDPVAEAAAEPTSGSRLKAMYRTTDDGAKEYLPGSWYDSGRGEECSFVRAADDVQRCLPYKLTASISSFSDAACTVPLAVTVNGCPKYATSAGPAPVCPNTIANAHIYILGAELVPPKTYGLQGATCVESIPLGPPFRFFAVGPEIPAASFVGSMVQHD